MVQEIKSSNVMIYFERFDNIFISMDQSQMLQMDEVWQNILQKGDTSPSIFQKFQEDHQIKKLKLENLNLPEIQEKIEAFHLKATYFSKNWLQNQYRIYIWYLLRLADFISIHPEHFNENVWKFLGKIFKKHPLDCRYFYRCCCKGKNVEWTIEEDNIISSLMKQISIKERDDKFKKKWTDIGLELFKSTNQKCFRKPKAIRERWLSHINPEIIKKDWTLEEDLILFEKVEEIGKKWAKIAKCLKNKSEHSVKNRYKKVLHHKCKGKQISKTSLSPEEENELIISHKQEVERRIKENQENKNEASFFPLPGYMKKKEEKETEDSATPTVKEPARIFYFKPIIITTSPQN